ncbi:hypothetical protein P4O66_017897 [Electrophorus voltai]|uniref:Uncharacterized protein n=1 Tax=Electrophorus voltai TaxID=2609070 RepID=A0AAD8YSR1_9TELE|nr:hypothetical protein P4O66_017897 [Electrophorus voltai]
MQCKQSHCGLGNNRFHLPFLQEVESYAHSPQAFSNPGHKMVDGDPEGEQRTRREEKASREASQREEQAEGSGTLISLT